jgi:hypothetical protein
MTEINLDKLSTLENIRDYETDSKTGLWLKRYHANWCSHCQKMKSEWDKFIKTSRYENIQIVSIEDEAVKKMSVRPNNLLGFPSIHLYKDNLLLSEYDGERTSEKIHEFIKETLPSISGGTRRNKTKRKKCKNKKKRSYRKPR